MVNHLLLIIIMIARMLLIKKVILLLNLKIKYSNLYHMTTLCNDMKQTCITFNAYQSLVFLMTKAHKFINKLRLGIAKNR